MKKWKCPECGNLSEIIERRIEGTCYEDTKNNIVDREWESGNGICEQCGFEEKQWYDQYFEIVEVEVK